MDHALQYNTADKKAFQKAFLLTLFFRENYSGPFARIKLKDKRKHQGDL